MTDYHHLKGLGRKELLLMHLKSADRISYLSLIHMSLFIATGTILLWYYSVISSATLTDVIRIRHLLTVPGIEYSNADIVIMLSIYRAGFITAGILCFVLAMFDKPYIEKILRRKKQTNKDHVHTFAQGVDDGNAIFCPWCGATYDIKTQRWTEVKQK